ncbi:MAG: flagellar motor switch protein FliG [Armatimonadota bacterium]
MDIREPNQLTGLEKASIVLIALGTDVTANVFKHLNEPEVEKLSSQIMKLQDIDANVIEAVVSEFRQMCTAAQSGLSGGKDFAARALEQAMGQEKATELLDKARTASCGRPFESLWRAEASKIASVLAKENPQIIGLVLTYLPSEKAALVLSELGDDIQAKVAHSICTQGETDPSVLSAIEEALNAKLLAAGSQIASAGGPKALVDILNNVTRSTEQLVLGSLASEDPEMGDQVRKMMFVFEDLIKLDDRTMQLVLREIDQEDLRMALKGANDDIKKLAFRNMSERAADMLKEDLELLTNAKPEDVDAGQQKIVNVVRKLIASGEAVLRNPDEMGGETLDEAQIEAQMMAQMEGEQVVEQSDQVELAA